VATIGPASAAPEVMRALIVAGMDVARLNFSHGELETHGRVIAGLRAAAAAVGRRLAIMADLPGPKLRVGRVEPDPLPLAAGEEVRIVPAESPAGPARVPVEFPRLPAVVRPGLALYLSDGQIELAVERVEGGEVVCRVVVGGQLGSRKGLHVPGADLLGPAFTERDRECLELALAHGVDAVSQSFVGGAADVAAVREAAAALGRRPFVIAKVERAVALERYDEILGAADGVMVARGDLGVEIPIERMAVVQKDLVARAVAAGKPVITATQMLESMVAQRRPTRAESTDVANAILDGSDAVMLSAESAVGAHPVEAVAMLARIAAATEPSLRSTAPAVERPAAGTELIAEAVRSVFAHAQPAAVFVPTLSGTTARAVARFRLPAWIVAISPHADTCQSLQFSSGVLAEHEPVPPEDWSAYARRWVARAGIEGSIALLTEGPSPRNPTANRRMEVIDLRSPGGE